MNCALERSEGRSATAIGTIDTQAAGPKGRFDRRIVQWSVSDDEPRDGLTDRGIATAIGKRESPSIPVHGKIHVLKHDFARPSGAPT